jgi:aminocarboxymuconate-semialdehyde decarboxylase
MKVIDFHSHIVPGRYPDRPPTCAEPNWPVMEKVDDQHSRMMIAGKQFRVFESFYWNADERIARLDEEGIALQVISPLPELLSYWLAADAAEAITDFMNEFVAGMVKAAPQRFAGIGSVVLQDPKRAVRQLEAMRKTLGLKPPLMPAVIGVPQEAAVAISSFIMTDVLARFPRLKLVFSHGGGTLGAVIDRFNAVWKAFEPMRRAVAIAPEEYVRRFYYDTVVFGPDYLRYLVNKVGASQLIGGTDGPADFGQPSIPELLEGAGLPQPDRERIAHANAELLLGA